MTKKIDEFEEVNGCLGAGEQDTDYILTEGMVDGLPTLYVQDTERYEYNQGNQSWSKSSCTIFSAVGNVSDLFNYEFTLDEIKEINDLSYTKGRVVNAGRYVKDAVKLVCDWWNEHHSDLGKVAYYRIDTSDDELIHKVLEKNYDICSGYTGNSEWKADMKDGVLNLTTISSVTYGHAICFVEIDGKRMIKDNYKGRDYNYYEVEHNRSEIEPLHNYGYVITKVAEDNYEEVQRLNEIKSLCNNIITDLGTLRHKVNDTNFQAILHYTAEKLRKKISDADEQLKKY